MAEPVRKCARCRLRVQGVRPLDDGLSYCAKCIAQMEQVRPAEPVHEDIAPDLKLIPEEPYVTTSASSETPDAALDGVQSARQSDGARWLAVDALLLCQAFLYLPDGLVADQMAGAARSAAGGERLVAVDHVRHLQAAYL